MNELQRFLAHAIQLEKESARQYKDLSEAMLRLGNPEVAEFFGEMAHYSRLHQKEAMDRAGFVELPKMKADEYQWPAGKSPEAAWGPVAADIDIIGAMDLAMHGEQSSHEYYQSIADQTQDDEVRALATEFSEEESEHYEQLEAWKANLSKLSSQA